MKLWRIFRLKKKKLRLLSRVEVVFMPSEKVPVDKITGIRNQIIIFHDDFITLDGKKYMITLLSYLQLMDLCNRNNHPVPDLFINLMPIIINHPNIVFNIEIKSNLLNNYQILSYLFKHIPENILRNQCIISSFNFLLLYQLRFLFFYNGPIAIILADTNCTD